MKTKNRKSIRLPYGTFVQEKRCKLYLVSMEFRSTCLKNNFYRTEIQKKLSNTSTEKKTILFFIHQCTFNLNQQNIIFCTFRLTNITVYSSPFFVKLKSSIIAESFEDSNKTNDITLQTKLRLIFRICNINSNLRN